MASKVHQWQRTIKGREYVVSSAKNLLSRDAMQSFYGSEEMYWAKPYEPEHLEIIVQNCLVMGLYVKASPAAPDVTRSQDTISGTQAPGQTDCTSPGDPTLTQIGMTRMVTDYCTIAYLTDVYVSSSYQNSGLGGWLVGCCREAMEAMPYLKGVMLLGDMEKRKTDFYEKTLGVKVYEQGEDHLVFMKKWYKPLPPRAIEPAEEKDQECARQ